jgi:hypothetical protein
MTKESSPSIGRVGSRSSNSAGTDSVLPLKLVGVLITFHIAPLESYAHPVFRCKSPVSKYLQLKITYSAPDVSHSLSLAR